MGSSIHRIAAYFFDTMIVMIITTLLTFWIPVTENYKNVVSEADKQIDLFQDGEIDYKEFYENSIKLNYRADKERIIISIVTIVVTVGYFATYAYYKGGQTLGKKLLKIKIVSKNMEDVSHGSMMIRSLLLNGVLTSVLSIVFLLFFSEDHYYIVYLLTLIHSLFVFISLFMILFRNDKRGLHDFISGTKVITMEK
jgi:uncharacterized RDD family membrane protein YckC